MDSSHRKWHCGFASIPNTCKNWHGMLRLPYLKPSLPYTGLTITSLFGENNENESIGRMLPEESESKEIEYEASENQEDLLTWKELLLGSAVGLTSFVYVWLVLMETIVTVFHFMRDHVF